MTIVSMSLRRVIPRRVALQQSPLLLHQPTPSCHNDFRSSCFLQRTGPCPFTPCLTRGSHRSVACGGKMRQLRRGTLSSNGDESGRTTSEMVD